jgi:hypothetical protein
MQFAHMKLAANGGFGISLKRFTASRMDLYAISIQSEVNLLKVLITDKSPLQQGCLLCKSSD